MGVVVGVLFGGFGVVEEAVIVGFLKVLGEMALVSGGGGSGSLWGLGFFSLVVPSPGVTFFTSSQNSRAGNKATIKNNHPATQKLVFRLKLVYFFPVNKTKKKTF